MAKAAKGQILVTDDVLARSRTEFESAPLEPFTVKGKSEPVQAFALGAAVGTRAHGARAPLVGRDEELRVLLEGLESARRYEGRIVEIVGDPGIGKSRLIEELAVEAEPDTFIWIQCEEYEGSTPYFAFDGLLRSLLARAAGGGEVTAGMLRGQVKRSAPHLLPWLPLLGVPIGLELPDTPETAPLEGEFRRRRLHETVTELLGMLLLQPTVLAFEDVHWLDEASAGLLEDLSRTVAARPWLVVAARRDRPTTFRVPDDADPVLMHLEALDADAAADLIERSSHELPLAPQQAEELARRAGGNPLFLTELLAAAHRREELEQLPDSIEALMMREIDMLRPPARRMLRCASVIGASFALDLLKECLDESWEEANWKSLADLVQPQGSGVFRFRHMLARDSAYEGLPYRRRRELHARVGEVIEARAGPDTDDDAALLSLHFFHASRFEQAWRYSRTAGARAQAVYANVDAAALYERALAAGRHLVVAKGDLASVAEALGDVRDRAGDYRRAEDAYRQARRMHEGDLVDEARLLLKHAWIPQRLGRYSQALRWIGRAQRLLEGLPGEAAARQRAELHAWHAEINIHQGRFAEAILWCRRATDEAEPVGQKDALAFAYQLLDWAYMAKGMPEQATYSQRALALFEELGNVRGQSAVYNNLGMWAYFEGDWSEAVELYGRARDIRERMGDPIHVAVADENIAEILIDQGHLEEAERLLQSATRVWRASGWRAEMATAAKLLGKVRSRSGRFDEALELLEDARTAYREVGAHSAVNETEAWMAECYLLRGDGEAALDLSTEALARAEASGGFEVATLKRVRAYALLQLGRRSTAREALEESLEAGRVRKVDYEVALSLGGLILLLEEDDTQEVQALEDERDAILERLQIESPRALLPSLA
jgi:tetratricopeptide (TPR) repeat protein